MAPLLPLTLALALASPLAELTYASPPKRASPTLEQHKLSVFDRGARLFVASHGVNLREGPSAGARVVTRLPFGAEVRVVARGAREAVSSRVDHWYRVVVVPEGEQPTAEGWLFGGTLTPFVRRANLDEDAALERVSAAWSWRHTVSLRAFDDGAERARVEWRPSASWRGGRITKLATHAATATGVPLVELEVLVGDPDAAPKTWWRVFYAYRPASDDETAALEEVFSVYRSAGVDARVRFDPATKSAEVTLLRDGKATRSERYPLAPHASAPPPPPAHADHECFVHVEELPPLLPKASRTLEEQHVVEEQASPGGGRVVVRHGGCVHYTQVWTLPLPGRKVPEATAARLAAAKQALEPFEAAGPILEALDEALESGGYDERGTFRCGDATCAVEAGALDGRPALVVSYDFPL